MITTEYEARIANLDIYPHHDASGFSADWYYALGITGEAGEVADKIKKLHRDGPAKVQPFDIALELGDVLWYLTRLANLKGFTLDQIMNLNVAKLEDRQRRGTQKGSGDNR